MNLGRGIAAGVAGVLVVGMVAFNMDEVDVVCGPDPSVPAAYSVGEKFGDVGKVLHAFTEGDAPSVPEVYRTVMGGIGTVMGWVDNLGENTKTGEDSSWQTGWRVESDRRRALAIASCCPTNAVTPDNPVPDAPPPEAEPFDPKLASISTSTGSPQRPGFTPENKSIAQVVVREVAAAGLDDRAAVVALAAGMQESGPNGPRNLNYGEGSSLGPWQLIDSNGTREQRLDVTYGARWFLTQLQGVQGWEQMSINDAAQAVERSGHPDRYGRWESDARRLLAAVGGTEAGSLPPATTEPIPACPAGGGTVQGGVATWNVRYGNAFANVHAGLAEMAKTSAVIGLQEVSPAVRVRLRKTAGWEMTSNNTATPIMYDPKRYMIVDQGVVKALPEGVRVEYSPVDGSRSAGPKSIVWAQLRDKSSSAVFYVVNTHMLVSKAAGPKRRAAYDRQLAAVTRVVAEKRALGATVLVTGDFNDPWKVSSSTSTAMAAVGAVASWQSLGQLNTHGTATLDDVWAAGASPTSQATLAPRGSDHRPVVVTFAAAPGEVTGGGTSPASFDQQKNPRTVAQAIAWMRQADATDGAPGERVWNRCERYMNLAYGLGSGYDTARQHWEAPGERHPGKETPPRGALVFWGENHVALSLGDDMIISTDYNAKTGRYQQGMISAGPITDIDKWGPRLGWRPPTFPGSAA